MTIYTVQNKTVYTTLNIQNIIYADNNKCNHPHAEPAYQRLFATYNQQKHTNYKSFFWGFSDLRLPKTTTLKQIKTVIAEKTGQNPSQNILLTLTIPDKLLLQTDFYNFTDYIYAISNSDATIKEDFANAFGTNDIQQIKERLWISVFENRQTEKQVIFPYIKKEWIQQTL